ncbi:cytochrome P450 [Desarmillaria tabescens]|uniref:Cytochrome P450 n=1 Tax=Armillaria tabescens TaxID=1929756 RepID=A0AA39KFS5_ARMTA|nr:cytochrome P450 [Desarmillaria tabescens]KAK0460227.1 cytochrome P450 [Desarmillaria tabescens]
MPSFLLLPLFVLACVVRRCTARQLPPGPRGLPFIGNILDMPTTKPWLTFARWSKLYGDICSVTVLGQTFIVIGSSDTAVDLLAKRSSAYSDRPHLTMACDLARWNLTIPLMSSGNTLRTHRRLLHGCLNASIVDKFAGIQENEVRQLLKRLLEAPEKFHNHNARLAAYLSLRIAYGYDSEVKEDRDKLLQLVERTMAEFSKLSAPGTFLVDQLPFLRFPPEWLPGMGFKRLAHEWRKDLDDLANVPFNFTKGQVAAGREKESFVSALLHEKSAAEYDIKWAASTIYGGGGETTTAALDAFFLAMVLYPSVQKQAQEELDSLLNDGERLPSLSDRDKLPYINALCLEVLRYHSVVSTNIPHCTSQADVYNGYYIPKGSLVIANIWNMTHDPKVYQNPMVFDPTRFLATPEHVPERDPRDIAFGFGRRICPGRYLANATVFMVCAVVLSTFDISKVEGSAEPVLDASDGTISHPAPFFCSITPRSRRAVYLINITN